MMEEATLAFDKMDGLLPAVVQDIDTGCVLMLGYMNEEALQQTKETGKVTFFSRSKKRLWMKGESSGNVLHLVEVLTDCDADALLVKARPAGPVCHTGSDTCFKEVNTRQGEAFSFLEVLSKLIEERKNAAPEESYTARLMEKGIPKVAQKVGEEAVEVVIDAVAGNDEALREEAADLLFHLMVLFAMKEMSLKSVIEVLQRRNR